MASFQGAQIAVVLESNTSSEPYVEIEPEVSSKVQAGVPLGNTPADEETIHTATPTATHETAKSETKVGERYMKKGKIVGPENIFLVCNFTYQDVDIN